MQIVIITIALLTKTILQWYSLISAQIAGFHYLYIPVVHFLNSLFCVLTTVYLYLPTLVYAFISPE